VNTQYFCYRNLQLFQSPFDHHCAVPSPSPAGMRQAAAVRRPTVMDLRPERSTRQTAEPPRSVGRCSCGRVDSSGVSYKLRAGGQMLRSLLRRQERRRRRRRRCRRRPAAAGRLMMPPQCLLMTGVRSSLARSACASVRRPCTLHGRVRVAARRPADSPDPSFAATCNRLSCDETSLTSHV